MKNTIYAGFGRRDITPVESVPMAGFGNTSFRKHTVVLDQLYATCVALTDENDSTVLLYHIDLISLPRYADTQIREAVTAATGIGAERIILGCTHTHSAPDLTNPEEVIQRYFPVVVAGCVEAAREALADRKEARIFVGEADTRNLNFVKHYYHVDENGQKQFFGDCFGTSVINETTRHTTEAYPTMHILKFVRQGGKDVIIANWRAHATLTGSGKKYDLSADFPGAFRTAMEQRLDCCFAFFQGAAGNINPRSRLQEENRTLDYMVHGQLLADCAQEALSNVRQIEPGPICLRQTVLNAPSRKSDEATIAAAKRVRKVWMETYDHALAMAQKGDAFIRSVYQANAIVGREGIPDTLPIELNAICVGQSLAFVTAPHELFDTLTEMIEAGSVFEKTVTMGYCHAYCGYMPSQYGFDYTCYESDCCRFVPGTGEVIVENLLRMLKELKR